MTMQWIELNLTVFLLFQLPLFRQKQHFRLTIYLNISFGFGVGCKDTYCLTSQSTAHHYLSFVYIYIYIL